MSFVLKVEKENGGGDAFTIGKENIVSVDFVNDTPNDSNARADDFGASVIVKGKIITPSKGDPVDGTMKLAAWSLVSSDFSNCYRQVTVTVIASDAVIRNVILPNAYIVDYTEDYGDQDGVGTFYLHMKQRKNSIFGTQITGGYAE